MDVEQRLALAKMVKRLVRNKEVSALIIDHDLLFLSQVADKAMVFLGEPGRQGYAREPESVEHAFDRFLSRVGITFRKDPQSGRPRANKPDSRLDREQKEKGKYFLG